MRRLSIFSSDDAAAAARPPRRRWAVFAVMLLVLLASAEAALRFPQVRALLPSRTHFYHSAIVHRIDAIERLKLVYGGVDVLFIGSSIVLTNVHPLIFDSLAGHDERLVSFNAGLPGLWPTSVHLYAQNVWLPLAAPRVVVQGVRYAEMAATTHAKNASQVWSGRIEASWQESGLLTNLHAAAVQRIHLLQYHGALTKLLERFRDGWVGEVDADEDDRYAVRGYLPRGGPAISGDEDLEGDLPNDGTCANDGCRTGFDALRRTIAAVRASGAQYVLVNVPEHSSRWQGRDARERYRAYIDAMSRFASSEGIGFIDPTDGDPLRFAALPYSDLAHMTASGARQFTRHLASRLGPLVESARHLPPAARGSNRADPLHVTLAGASERRGHD